MKGRLKGDMREWLLGMGLCLRGRCQIFCLCDGYLLILRTALYCKIRGLSLVTKGGVLKRLMKVALRVVHRSRGYEAQ